MGRGGPFSGLEGSFSTLYILKPVGDVPRLEGGNKKSGAREMEERNDGYSSWGECVHWRERTSPSTATPPSRERVLLPLFENR